jgi:hypothetical protein
LRRISSHAKAMLEARTAPLPEPILDSLLLPPVDELDKIMRYEAHLDRQFQELLQRLMSWRRVYIDISGAESAEP